MSSVNEDTETESECGKEEDMKNRSRRSSAYNVDVWRELRRRWMAVGVLGAVLCAVMSPALGAPGGVLRTQYLWFLPLSYIYYSAGARAGAGWRAGRGGAGAGAARLAAVSCAHAGLLAPAFAALLLAAAPHASQYAALLTGVVGAAAGGGCSWLSLAMSAHEAAPLLTAANYAASLLSEPAAMLLLCGRASVPPLSSVAGALCGAVPAFCAGCAVGAGWGDTARGGGAALRGCALALLYVQCCEALVARGGGALPPADLCVALLLELSWLGMSAGACWGYARAGLLSAADAHLVAACALPKAAEVGWSCVPPALARLPGVFLVPAQALLLAALPPPERL